jgi:hypothetical protein
MATVSGRWQVVLATLGLAAGLGMILVGFDTGLTGRDASNLPDAIEAISPGDGQRVLRQSQVIVDFAEGWEASLTIDGVELPVTRLDELTSSGAQPKPGAQVELPPTAVYDPGNFTISFLPQEGAAITELKQGKHTGKVRYWPTKNPDQIRVYSWTFYTD